jgi:hypothetical protein
MGAWLYPISSKGGYRYEIRPGKWIDMSFEVFREYVIAGRFRSDKRWVVNQNFKAIRAGDELFIYTGDADRGLIGYGRVVDKVEEKDARLVIFRLNQKRTRELLLDPIPAPLIRQLIPFPRKTVINLTPHKDAFQRLLPWSHFRTQQESLALSPLQLKPRRRVVAEAILKRDTRWLLHDTVLQPVANFLSANKFVVGGRSIGRLRPDMVARRDRDLIVVEGKVIQRDSGRDEARTGLGQLLEYSWHLKHRHARLHLRHHLWLAFSSRPAKTVIDFLEHYKVLVSWVKNDAAWPSEGSKREWSRRFRTSERQ